jgi:hypothetical protein
MDHSRRVSAKENVDAFKAWARNRDAALAVWVKQRPLRRRLRRTNVLTMLGFAGVVLSIAALMIVVGIGKTQIVAAESMGKHRADLAANPWFLIGLVAVAVGVLFAGFALSANASQATARREFPNLAIRVYLEGSEEVPLPGDMMSLGGPIPRRVSLAQYGIVIQSREIDRLASLSFSLLLQLTEPVAGGTTWEFRPLERDLPDSAPTFNLLPLPFHAEPGRTTVGEVIFDVSGLIGERIDPSVTGEITVADLGSGTTVSLLATVGASYGT